MKAYVATTGLIFGLLTLAHVLRIAYESRALASDPWYMLITTATAALAVWAFLLIARRAR